jgi:hypothetical protein
MDMGSECEYIGGRGFVRWRVFVFIGWSTK